jgi:hypothetical protein
MLFNYFEETEIVGFWELNLEALGLFAILLMGGA